MISKSVIIEIRSLFYYNNNFLFCPSEPQSTFTDTKGPFLQDSLYLYLRYFICLAFWFSLWRSFFCLREMIQTLSMFCKCKNNINRWLWTKKN